MQLIMLALITGRRKEEVMRNTAAPLDQESPYIAEIWGVSRFKQCMESCTLLRAITSTVESKQSKGEHVFQGASTCTEPGDESTYHSLMALGIGTQFLVPVLLTLACLPDLPSISISCFATAVAGLRTACKLPPPACNRAFMR